MALTPACFDEGTAQLPGVALTWRAVGPRGSRPLIALHGLCSRASTWDRFAATAAAHGRRVIAIDMRGHGGSSRPGTYTCRSMRDDVLAFCDRLGIDQLDLIGHSLGGRVATLIAQHSPERVHHLIVEDAPIPASIPDDPVLTSPRQRFLLAVQSRMMWTQAGRCDLRMTQPLLQELMVTPDPHWWSDLPKTSAATMLVLGSRSELGEQRLHVAARHVPGCRVVTIPGAGHNIHHGMTQALAAEVLPFLESSTAR